MTVNATFGKKPLVLDEKAHKHCWLDNLKIEAQMLNGEIRTPHLRRNKNIRAGLTQGSICQACEQATTRRNKYLIETGFNPYLPDELE